MCIFCGGILEAAAIGAGVALVVKKCAGKGKKNCDCGNQDGERICKKPKISKKEKVKKQEK